MDPRDPGVPSERRSPSLPYNQHVLCERRLAEVEHIDVGSRISRIFRRASCALYAGKRRAAEEARRVAEEARDAASAARLTAPREGQGEWGCGKIYTVAPS